MTGAFLGGVAAWLATSAIYLGAAYMCGWSYTGHWPVHAWWLVSAGAVAGLSNGVKAAKGLLK